VPGVKAAGFAEPGATAVIKAYQQMLDPAAAAAADRQWHRLGESKASQA
jgi:hypothetical protein